MEMAWTTDLEMDRMTKKFGIAMFVIGFLMMVVIFPFLGNSSWMHNLIISLFFFAPIFSLTGLWIVIYSYMEMRKIKKNGVISILLS